MVFYDKPSRGGLKKQKYVTEGGKGGKGETQLRARIGRRRPDGGFYTQTTPENRLERGPAWPQEGKKNGKKRRGAEIL